MEGGKGSFLPQLSGNWPAAFDGQAASLLRSSSAPREYPLVPREGGVNTKIRVSLWFWHPLFFPALGQAVSGPLICA